MNPLAQPPPAERVLVIRLGALGDVVRTLPAARALREAYAGAHFAWLVEPPSASLLATQSWIDEVIVFPRDSLRSSLRSLRLAAAGREAKGFLGHLRGLGFDLVVDFHAILKSGVIARASRAVRRVSYAAPYGREGAQVFATDRARIGVERCSRFERNEALVRYLGVRGPLPERPLEVDEGSRAHMARELGGDRPLAIHPGTSDDTPHKRWSVAGYARVAQALLERDGVRSIVTAGPARDDAAFAEAIVAAAPGAARPAPETRGLTELAALFAACSAYLGSDTGPMHVASLVGTPVVQLLGPTDPVENTPYPATASQTVREAVGCNPCRRGCSAATCMGAIHPDSVVRAVTGLLAAPAA